MNKGANLDCFIVYERVDSRRSSHIVGFVCIASKLSSTDRVREFGKNAHEVYADLQEVVRTVNQVYAAKVVAVIAAKSQPNLYV